jgi:phosphatidylserine/phosphatidylglycerophosphate/cardiolipin synthase-like enzyme
MAKRRSSPNSQRALISGVSGVVIIIIVLIAQLVTGIDIIPEEETNTSGGNVVIDDSGGGGFTSAIQEVDGGIDGGWFQLYFTSPINTTDESRFVGAPLENALVRALDSAQTSIDAALYELNSAPVTQALIRATEERSVRVRVVTDGEFGLEDPDSTIEELELAGIDVVSDGARNGFMHNKFFVIDGLYVWTGSTNITRNDIYNNNNNAILIRSSRLAQNYTTEFEELFRGQFGKTSLNVIPNPVIMVGETRIETYFESEGDVPARLAELISQSNEVRFMAFSLTLDSLFQPMLAGHATVWGIVEASSRRFVGPLYCAGINPRQDGNPNILHHKVFIFDDDVVAMGSFNFTSRASDDNDENMLIIHNADIARAYRQEFDKRWAEAQVIPNDAFDCP